MKKFIGKKSTRSILAKTITRDRCKLRCCKIKIALKQFSEHMSRYHRLRFKYFCKECKLLKFQSVGSSKVIKHINKIHKDLKVPSDKLIGYVGKFNGENSSVFGNKMATGVRIGFKHPIARELYEEIKLSFVINGEIKTRRNEEVASAMRKIENLCSTIDKPIGENKIYFKLSEKELRRMKTAKKQFNLKRFLISLASGGYIGKTVNERQREQGHKSSKDTLVTFPVEVVGCPPFNELFEMLIIKMVNIKNFTKNQRNGTSWFVDGLDHKEHLLVAIHFIREAFDQAKSYYDQISMIEEDSLDMDTDNEISSQSTCHTFCQSLIMKRKVIDSSNITPIAKLKHGMTNLNVVVVCNSKSHVSTIPATGQQFFMFQISDRPIVNVQCVGEAASLFDLIQIGQQYQLNQVNVERYGQNGAHKLKIQISDNQRISEVIEQVNFDTFVRIFK